MRLYKTFKFLTSWSSIICELNNIILHLELQEGSKLSQLVRNRQQRLMGLFL